MVGFFLVFWYMLGHFCSLWVCFFSLHSALTFCSACLSHPICPFCICLCSTATFVEITGAFSHPALSPFEPDPSWVFPSPGVVCLGRYTHRCHTQKQTKTTVSIYLCFRSCESTLINHLGGFCWTGGIHGLNEIMFNKEMSDLHTREF